MLANASNENSIFTFQMARSYLKIELSFEALAKNSISVHVSARLLFLLVIRTFACLEGILGGMILMLFAQVSARVLVWKVGLEA